MRAYEELLDNIVCSFRCVPILNTQKADFNIFRILGIQTKEVIVCRFIAELLDPKGTHNMGAASLKAFFETVLKKVPPENIENAVIKIEEPIDNYRRVDIAIHIGKKVYPIEAKIWAGDQDAQLFDYFCYYKKRKSIEKIYYLTPFGKPPSNESIRNLDLSLVKCISFKDDIFAWLSTLLKLDIADRVSYSITQFKEIISDMCKENQQVEIIKNILNLDCDRPFEISDTLEAAVAIINEKEALSERIMINYLRSNIILPEGYELIEDTEKETDKHSLLCIMKEARCIAWICVDTNLYIVAKKVKTEKEGVLWSEVSENYAWQYLHPEGTAKKFPLKQLNCIFNYKDKKIDIKKFLCDIL